MRFVDSNVLLYSVSTSPQEQRKRDLADAVLAGQDLALSVQVLQEFYVHATRRNGLSHGEAVTLVASFGRFPVQDMTVDLLHAALAAKARYRISYWDAAIIEAARALGCETVLSEDLSAGQDYGGVRVVNPFA
jgi:predicted nucleic acid-binding protein